MIKICKKCNTEQDIRKGSICSKCVYDNRKEYMKNYYEKNSDIIIKNTKEYNKENRDKIKEYRKEYNIENKDKLKMYYDNLNRSEYMKEYHKLYYIDNKEKLNTKKNEYHKNRCKTDKVYKLYRSMQSIIYRALKNKGYKKYTKTFNILGCSYEEFKTYLENLFEPWMTWQNYGIYTGNYNETWQLDHIQPISNGITENEVIKLNHYTNFRPLCSKLNLEKGNKNV